MNLFVTYAKVPMSFRALYQSKRGGRGDYVVAIACAMSGLLIVNVWSVLSIVASAAHNSLVGRHYLEVVPYTLLVAFLFILQIIFVRFVFKKAEIDPAFAAQVRATKPVISMWYAGITIGLLAASTAAMILTT